VKKYTYTSTPKSKRLIEEEVSLLSLNSENEGEHIYNHNIFFSVYFVIPVQKANIGLLYYIELSEFE
jgi:hypothetical protein